jgi:hypothetical protein
LKSYFPGKKGKIGQKRILCGALDFFMDEGDMGYKFVFG